MGTLAVNHETDTEQANQESEEQEPLVSTSVENNSTSDNGEESKGDSLSLSKVVLARLGPVFGNSCIFQACQLGDRGHTLQEKHRLHMNEY